MYGHQCSLVSTENGIERKVTYEMGEVIPSKEKAVFNGLIEVYES